MKKMGKRWVSASMALTVGMILAPAAMAEVGPYLGLEAGSSRNVSTHFRTTTTFTPNGLGSSTTDNGSQDAHFRGGFAGGFTAGYALPGHLRPEVEIAFRRNNLSNADAAERAITAMGNIWYDFELHDSYFYLGGGIGDAHVRLKNSAVNSSDTNDLFAYQGGAGVGYIIDQHISIGLDYRYLATTSRGSFKYGPFPATNGNQSGQAVESIRARYRNNSVMLGVRYNFGSLWDPLNPYRRDRPVQVVPLDTGK